MNNEKEGTFKTILKVDDFFFFFGFYTNDNNLFRCKNNFHSIYVFHNHENHNKSCKQQNK